MKQVSIVIPVYNAGRFLKETLNAIINQTYGNIEVLCVDDGSTDDSKQIINDFILKDQRIKYIYQENSGAPEARNNGLKNSTSEYIIFFDADDLMEHNCIESLVYAMEENNVDLAVGSYSILSSDKKDYQKYSNEKIELSNDNIFNIAGKDPLPCNKLYKKSIIENANIKFDNLRLAQDLNFFIKYLLNAKTAATTDKIVMNYRIVENSISHTYTLKILEIEKSFEKIEEYASGMTRNINDEKWYQLLKILHYTHQYTKIPYLKTYRERKQAIDFFEQNISKLKNNSSISKLEFEAASNKYQVRKLLYKLIRYQIFLDLFLFIKNR